MAFYFTTCYPSFHCSLFQLQSHIAKNEHLTPFKFIFLSKEACTELLLPEVLLWLSEMAAASCCMTHQGPACLRAALEMSSL